MDVPIYQQGDLVQVIEDMVQVFSLQDGHGGWANDMSLVSSLATLRSMRSLEASFQG